MKAGITIVARVESTRLPHKLLLPLAGMRVIDHVVTRYIAVGLPVVLCTTTSSADDALAGVGDQHGIPVFRGSENNVPARLLAAADMYGLDFVIIAEADEVLADPSYIDRIITEAQERTADFISLKNFPIGAYLLGIRVSALRRVCDVIGSGENVNTDGWGRYFTDTGWFQTAAIDPEEEALRRPQYRFTLDYPEDYELLKAVFERLYVPNRVVSLRAALELLDGEPALVAINEKRVREYARHVHKYPPLVMNDASGRRAE